MSSVIESGKEYFPSSIETKKTMNIPHLSLFIVIAIILTEIVITYQVQRKSQADVIPRMATKITNANQNGTPIVKRILNRNCQKLIQPSFGHFGTRRRTHYDVTTIGIQNNQSAGCQW
jgi:hypothetical protein